MHLVKCNSRLQLSDPIIASKQRNQKETEKCVRRILDFETSPKTIWQMQLSLATVRHNYCSYAAESERDKTLERPEEGSTIHNTYNVHFLTNKPHEQSPVKIDSWIEELYHYVMGSTHRNRVLITFLYI